MEQLKKCLLQKNSNLVLTHFIQSITLSYQTDKKVHELHLFLKIPLIYTTYPSDNERIKGFYRLQFLGVFPCILYLISS